MSKLAIASPTHRRLKQIVISPEMILETLKVPNGGIRVGDMLLEAETDSVPDGATAVRCGINEQGNVVLVIEDESFPSVQVASEIPQLDPRYRCSSINNGDRH